MKQILPMVLIGLVSVSAAVAQELRPFENYSVHLGDVTGSVYVTSTSAVSHMVATLNSDAYSTPIRFVTDLAANQSATLSVPRGLGQSALEVTFTRCGDRVLVSDASTVVGSN